MDADRPNSGVPIAMLFQPFGETIQLARLTFIANVSTETVTYTV